MVKKILLDTDIGGDIDDALCLAYLLQQPLCKIVGITTVGGEVEKRAMIADAICKAAGKNISIYAGADQTLLPNSLYPTPDGAVKLTNWPHETTFKKNQAVDFMRKTIRENPNEISLLAIGHLTNIALLFLVDPEIPSLLKEIYIMSGVFSAELEASMEMPMGNWNSWIDPHASAIVYNTNVPIHKTFGLNVTSKLVLTQEDRLNIFSTHLMRVVEDFGSPWLQENEITFHDPLVAACLFEPQLCNYQRGFIEVDSYNKRKLGMMSFLANTRGNCEIASSVDRNRFFEHYVSICCN
ncbi:hypothetical protein WQ54_09195 [Bacillus sp. SA1-12]|uniref:nucleoside hydrolase n=1 Tax=Bacillus sp. SA1-12 TaxID=1455638 RepID=UPI00062580FF|nr:nucleoside hydrolase [Bacillus sp. SA1-12]KKI92522.1 hypothetical protein WQ54_09195 [Bacillus sp. SA1-12]